MSWLEENHEAYRKIISLEGLLSGRDSCGEVPATRSGGRNGRGDSAHGVEEDIAYPLMFDKDLGEIFGGMLGTREKRSSLS